MRAGLYYLLDEQGEAQPFEGRFEDWLHGMVELREQGRTMLEHCMLSGTDIDVVTTFMGLNHLISQAEPPEVFATAVIGLPFYPVRYYATRGEALAGHAAIVEKVQSHLHGSGGYS